ncbi:MAG: hypothetical protein NUV48_07140 [Peptococcaceae bacterium]|nr:hypothetical protein [Peptococcaceae bacterium]
MKVVRLKTSKDKQELADELRQKQYEESVKNLARGSLPTLIESESPEYTFNLCFLEIQQTLSDQRAFKSFLLEMINTLPPGTHVRVGNRTMSVEEALAEILRQPFYRALMELKDELKL